MVLGKFGLIHEGAKHIPFTNLMEGKLLPKPLKLGSIV
jgi:hypothetical protein